MKQDIRHMPASQAYRVRHQELGEVIRGLDEELTRAMVDPAVANWGHVGDMSRALDLATQLRDILRGEVK